MPYTEAQKKATMKWMKENKESLCLSLDKGQKNVWKEYAERAGMPLIKYIEAAVLEKAERENLL